MREDEELGETLLEVRLLRESEAAALRESKALLDALESMAEVVDPTEAAKAFIESAWTTLGCDAVILLLSERGQTRIVHATDTALEGRVLDEPKFLDKPRRIIDLENSWRGGELLCSELGGRHSVISAPIRSKSGDTGALLALGRAVAAFSRADARLLGRLAGVAEQALSVRRLARRNALLGAVIERANSGVVIADATASDFPIVYVNEAFEKTTGYSREEALGQNCRFLSAEEPQSEVRTKIRKTLARRLPGLFELRNRRKDGSEYWCRLALTPVKDEDGRIIHIVGTQEDISERRRTEQERDLARTRLVDALTSASDAILLLDEHDKVVFCNPKYRQLFDLGENAVEGSDFKELWAARMIRDGQSAELAQTYAELRTKALRSGGRARREMQVAEEHILLVDETVTPDGGAVSVATDITELKKAERALAERAVAMDASSDAVGIANADGVFTYVNRAHLALFGYEDEDEVVGHQWNILTDAEGEAEFDRLARPHMEREGSWRGEIHGVARDGSRVSQEVTLTRMNDGGVVVVARDVAERKRMERERSKLRERLIRASGREAIGQLAAGVAHDFNNVLSAISGSASLLEVDLGENDPRAVHVQRIQAASEGASQLVGKLMTLSERKTERSRVDMGEMVHKALDVLAAAMPTGIDVHVDLPDENIEIFGDPTEMMQLVINLGINARDAIVEQQEREAKGTQKGRINISLALVSPNEPEAQIRAGQFTPGMPVVRLVVEDSGDGLDEESLGKVFAPYYTTKGDAGTGLGLSVIQGIVNDVGGSICVSRSVQGGARFVIYWPEGDVAESSSALAGQGALLPDDDDAPLDSELREILRGATILVAEDISAVGEVVVETLERAGAEATLCEDPRDALEAIGDDPRGWHLLVTDHDMPHLTGTDLAQECRKNAPNLPIVLCTALTDRMERAARQPELFDMVLKKPIKPKDLLSASAKAIMKRRKISSEEA